MHMATNLTINLCKTKHPCRTNQTSVQREMKSHLIQLSESVILFSHILEPLKAWCLAAHVPAGFFLGYSQRRVVVFFIPLLPPLRVDRYIL